MFYVYPFHRTAEYFVKNGGNSKPENCVVMTPIENIPKPIRQLSCQRFLLRFSAPLADSMGFRPRKRLIIFASYNTTFAATLTFERGEKIEKRARNLVTKCSLCEM